MRSACEAARCPLVLEDRHHHLVVPAPIVPGGVAVASLLDESGRFVGADSWPRERHHFELDAVQTHFPEARIRRYADRVCAVSLPNMFTAEGNADRGALVRRTRARQLDGADQHRRVVESLDGEADIVLVVRSPHRDAFPRRCLGRRGHQTRQHRYASGSICHFARIVRSSDR